MNLLIMNSLTNVATAPVYQLYITAFYYAVVKCGNFSQCFSYSDALINRENIGNQFIGKILYYGNIAW